jgi:hypothetical protein
MNTFFHPIICEGFYDVAIALSSGAPTFFAVLFLGYLMIQTRHDMRVGFEKTDHDMKAGFAQADHKLESVRAELRGEMNEGFAKLRSEISEVRFEIKELTLKTDHRFEKNEFRIESLETHDQSSKSKT